MANNANALVTGGANGLGAAQSRKLAVAGFKVVVVDKDVEAGRQLAGSLTEEGLATTFKPVDVLDLTDLSRHIDLVIEEVGGVSILVNNVGYARKEPYLDVTLDTFTDLLAVNTTAAFLIGQRVVPHMIASGYGRIINIGSATIAGLQPEFSSYVASKGALLGLTRALARELGIHGITVNLVNPGAVRTSAEMAVWAANHAEFEADILAHQSIKRRVTPEDVASLVAFLASEDAAMISGQSIIIDGGWTMQ